MCARQVSPVHKDHGAFSEHMHVALHKEVLWFPIPRQLLAGSLESRMGKSNILLRQ